MKWFQPLLSTLVFASLAQPLAAQDAAARPAWTASIVALTVATPKYPGSTEHRVTPFPMVQATLKNRLYVGPSATGIGAAVGGWLTQSPRLGVSAELGVQDGRPAGRSDALAGTDDRALPATVGVSVRSKGGPFELTLGASQGLNDRGGAVGTARVATTQMVGRRLVATVGVGATVANGRQMRRDFGITAAEGLRRDALIAAGDRRLDPAAGGVYRPEGGLRSVNSSLSLVYLVSPRWSVLSFGGLDRLANGAGRSPLVQQRAQFSAALGLGFRL